VVLPQGLFDTRTIYPHKLARNRLSASGNEDERTVSGNVKLRRALRRQLDGLVEWSRIAYRRQPRKIERDRHQIASASVD